jgi:hypothetical protein
MDQVNKTIVIQTDSNNALIFRMWIDGGRLHFQSLQDNVT